MKNLKFGLKEYFKPTPKTLRIIGDACLTVALFLPSIGFISGLTWLPIVVLIFSIVGKLLTNMFSEKEKRGGEDVAM